MNVIAEEFYPRPSWTARSIALAIVVLVHIVLLTIVFGAQTDVPVELRQVVNVVDIPIEPPPPEPTRAVDLNLEAPSPPPPQVPAPEFTIEDAQIAASSDGQSSDGGSGAGTAGEGNGLGNSAFPTCTNTVMPIFPSDARKRGETGTVTLLMQHDVHGKISVLGVARSSGSRSLDAAAIDAMRQWRCSPVIEGGRAVSAITKQEFNFSLKEPPKSDKR